MLRFVLRLRGAENLKKPNELNDVTLLQFESGFFCAVQNPARSGAAAEMRDPLLRLLQNSSRVWDNPLRGFRDDSDFSTATWPIRRPRRDTRRMYGGMT